MQNPEHVQNILNLSGCIVLFMKIIMIGISFGTFGGTTEEIVILNLKNTVTIYLEIFYEDHKRHTELFYFVCAFMIIKNNKEPTENEHRIQQSPPRIDALIQNFSIFAPIL